MHVPHERPPLQDSIFANKAKELLINQEKQLLSRKGRDRDAVLKAFMILERFFSEQGEPDVTEDLANRRIKFEDTWGRVI